jgi:hypothetical protein
MLSPVPSPFRANQRQATYGARSNALPLLLFSRPPLAAHHLRDLEITEHRGGFYVGAVSIVRGGRARLRKADQIGGRQLSSQTSSASIRSLY